MIHIILVTLFFASEQAHRRIDELRVYIHSDTGRSYLSMKRDKGCLKIDVSLPELHNNIPETHECADWKCTFRATHARTPVYSLSIRVIS